MYKSDKKIYYRNDIDGLRAIAVISVILYHFGYLPNGYLGVDVFFVISGFLITKIIYNEVLQGEFSINQFYLRRIRRILPLVMFVNLTALVVGLIVMLPNDLENLCRSIIATNFFGNNILEFIVTNNYWNIINEYKPLMHTWTLGIEEQFYFIYPLIFILLSGKRIKYITPTIILLFVVSILLYFSANSENSKFYLIHYRFFELALGGIGALLVKNKNIKGTYSHFFLLIILFVLFLDFNMHKSVQLFEVITASLIILISTNSGNNFVYKILENKVMVYLGKISFSLYMWHQLILAFTRYFIIDKYNIFQAGLILIIIIVFSILSYSLIEQPFRDKNKIKTKHLIGLLLILITITTGVSLYVYFKGGVYVVKLK